MRYQGKVTNWKDDQGFGFVTPNGGGQKAFVHIKAFSKISHRPAEGDIITYELAIDERRRYFAKNIRFAGETSTSSSSSTSGSLGTIFTLMFCLLIAISASIDLLPLAIGVLYLTSSIVTFLVYAMDKSAAQNDAWRTKESTLHFLALVGGWPGALLAQTTLRHKSKKQEFQFIFWVTVMANCFILGWLFLTKNGSNFLSSILGHFV